MAQDWDIRSRSEACTTCKTAFEDGQPYLSALRFGEAGYERGDFCATCWPAAETEFAPYSSWQGTYRKPPASADREPLKKETAESLLRKLIEDEDPQNEAVIYILAVMLERKKTLIERDVTVDDLGTVHRVYEHRQTGETYLILDPRLELDKLVNVQTRVIEMLGGPLSRSSTGQPSPETTANEAPELPDPTDSPDPSDLPDEFDDGDEFDDEDEFEDDEDDEDEDN
jgi:hypothetical protein